MSTLQMAAWSEIREKVKAVNLSLFELIEAVDPQKIPFYVGTYPYGEQFATPSTIISSGVLTNIPLFPAGIILEKVCEWHCIGEDGKIYPESILLPGDIFNSPLLFNQSTQQEKHLFLSAGSLSAFMLPNIGCRNKHDRLKKTFNLTRDAPKNPYEHYLIFKELAKNQDEAWQCTILYFSQDFIKVMQNNMSETWVKLKLYFSEILRDQLMKKMHAMACYDILASSTKINRYRPAPFIIDTAKYIFKMSLGAALGVKPATDEQYLPLQKIQNSYSDYYELPYTPTVLIPALLQKNDAVYYALQRPLAKINAFKTNAKSLLNELQLLKNVLLAYQSELKEEKNAPTEHPLYLASNQTIFDFYHYQSKEAGSIKDAYTLQKEDQRFNFAFCTHTKAFAHDAKLFRGCIKLCKIQD